MFYEIQTDADTDADIDEAKTEAFLACLRAMPDDSPRQEPSPFRIALREEQRSILVLYRNTFDRRLAECREECLELEDSW